MGLIGAVSTHDISLIRLTCHGEYYPAVPLSRLAIRSTPSPVWEKAVIVVRDLRNLASLHNYRNPPRLIPAPNNAPVARRCNRRGLAQPDHRGKMKNRPGGVYSRPSDSSFSLPRGMLSSSPPHPSRYSLDTFSRLGEGFYCCAFSPCLAALSNNRRQIRTTDTHNNAPVARRCNRRGLAQPGQGEK